MRRTKLSFAVWVLVAPLSGCDQPSGHVSNPMPVHDGSDDAGVPDEGHARQTAPASSHTSPSPAEDGGVDVPPPPAVRGNAPCVLSADCPAGQHCDLGECYQECSATAACGDKLTCSPRGRCLAPGDKDADPPPVVSKAGSVHTDQNTIQLTDRDDELRLHLLTDSKDEVRYRVEVNAPFLSLRDLRGTFRDETTLTLAVDATAAGGKDVTGSVRVITNLGDVLFTTPMRSSVTGVYQGTMTYDGAMAGPPLGATHLGLDVSETHGNVLVRVAPERSLLFPSFDGHSSVNGSGSFTYTDGVDVVLRQVVPKGFAGEDDPFNRDIGREVRFHLTPGPRGALDGTFHETIHGLFATPLSLAGHAHFERNPCKADVSACTPTVDPGAVLPTMPVADANAEPNFVATFPGWSDDGCTTASPDMDPANMITGAGWVDAAAHAPFVAGLSGTWPPATKDPLGDLADACERDLGKTAPDPNLRCAQIAPLACRLSMIVASSFGTSLYDSFGTLYTHVLDVPVFVAQNDLVRAVSDSFVSGYRAELDRLRHARTMLHAPATWVLHPRLLEYLRTADPSFHTGADEAPTSLAARTLSRLLLVRSTIDAEKARIDGNAGSGTDAARQLATQKNGLEALFEAAVLQGIAANWKKVPPELGVAFVDVLTPMDAGFSAFSQKSRVLGVADGVVPNVYDPTNGKTNFEQLLDIADARIDSAARDETTFRTEGRSFEDQQDRLDEELEQIVSGYEARITDDCGPSFDVTSTDWSRCGENGAGVVGSKQLAIAEAYAKMQSAESRVNGKSALIRIEEDRIDKVTHVRIGTIEFTGQTGERLKSDDLQMATLNGMQQALTIASQASVWNGGAPLAEALGAFAIEEAKGAVEADRQDAQTAQDMRAIEDNLSVEQIDSAATIKGLLVDMAQAKLEMQEEVIAELQARADAENALADAKEQQLLRARGLARIGRSSLRDPTSRVLESRAALDAIRSRAAAQTSLLQAGRGLEYYLDYPLGDVLGDATMNAYDADEQHRLSACLRDVFNQSRLSLPKTESYTTDLSVRKLLGITGPRKDDVTGESLSEGAQLRQVLLRNANLDGNGGVAVGLSTTLDPGNQLWSANVCDDRIVQIEAELVGDFLGDNEAEVYVDLQGGGVLRKCDGPGLMSWSTSGHAVVQAGVNTFGTAPPNDSLRGLSVASSKWQIAIPGPSASPANRDVDLKKVEDIVLRIHHEARPIPSNPAPLVFDCLRAVGSQ